MNRSLKVSKATPFALFLGLALLLGTMAIFSPAQAMNGLDSAMPVSNESLGGAQLVESNESIMTYTPTSDIFSNPERGFYKHTETHSNRYTLLTSTELAEYRTNGHTLILRVFYLEDFISSPISNRYLNNIQRDFDAMREAGVKVVVRFAYTNSDQGSGPWDASKDQILAHLEQLAPILQANSDVIAVMQAGFIGAWGEWYQTSHFVADPNNPGIVTANDYANRREVLFKILEVLPNKRIVQLRTPRYKTNIYNTTNPILPTQAFDRSNIARTGHHNDCFLSNDTDSGTYEDINTDYPYLETETTYLPMGGETCNDTTDDDSPSNRSLCTTALQEMKRFHWSYINAGYHPDVLNSWVEGGCMDEIKRLLGYRFVLEQGVYTNQVRPGHGLDILIDWKNEGYAAPFNSRGVELILRHTVSNEKYFVNLPEDLRRLTDRITIDHTIGIPNNIPPGEYDLLLHLPDPESTLHGNPKYSIRLANQDVWEEDTGYNKLLHTVTIATDAQSDPYTGHLFFMPMFTSCGDLTQEAEAGVLTGELFVIGHDSNASNGQYVHVLNGFGNRSRPDENHKVTYCFTVSTPGTYIIKAKAYAANGGNDSFYVRVDGAPNNAYLWDVLNNTTYETDYVSHRRGDDPVEVELSAGQHIVTIYLREDGTRLDTLELELVEPPTITCGGLTQEAEAGQLTELFEIADDPNASNSQYVHVPNGFGNRSRPDENHKVSYCFNVPTAGTYRIKAKAYAANGGNDSFYVRVDGAPASAYLWDILNNTTYETDYVSHRRGDDPVEVQLSAGEHIVTIYLREDGTRLDTLGLERVN